MKILKKHKIICTIVFFAGIYLFFCLGLYLFEPVNYSAPDLNNFQEYFDMYSYYSKNIDDEFYIKQISVDDILSADNDERVKYVANTAVAVASEDITFDQVTTLLNDYNAEICGYIKDVNFYQFEFLQNMSFFELDEICQKMSELDIFKIVLPDFFEESPAESVEFVTDFNNYSDYCYDLINADAAWNYYYQYDNNVNVGIIDVLVDYNNELLNVVNRNEYTTDTLFNGSMFGVECHGTHVAGIINASPNQNMHGMAPEANLYSYNGINVSTSYWVSSLCDMLLKKDIKVINISMGYNSYICTSAQLGDENAVRFIDNENILFSEILNYVIDNDKEFVICIAAGNSTGESVYRTPFLYFGYGDKKILNKLDFLKLFDSCPEYVDSQYSFFLADCEIDEVKDRIISVGSIGESKNYTFFSNAGNVDIVAPGEDICSTVLNDEYEYMWGTSMASPFVAGTAAMMFTVNPELDGSQVKEILLLSATDSVSAYEFNYPILNAGNAVKHVVEESF